MFVVLPQVNDGAIFALIFSVDVIQSDTALLAKSLRVSVLHGHPEPGL